MKSNIEKIRDNLYIKKGITGYRIVYPIKNEDGSINWHNLIYGGNIWNFLKIMLFFVLIFIVMFAYSHDTQTCRDTMNNLTNICIQINNATLTQNQSNSGYFSYNLNFTEFQDALPNGS